MQVVGLDFDSDKINLAIMNKHKDLILFKSLDVSDISENDVKLLYTSRKDKNLISSSLGALDVLIKTIPFNVKNSLFLKKAIKFQQDSISSLDVNETIRLPIYLKSRSILKFFITTKELLKKHLSRLNHLNIDPDQVTLSAIALIRFSNFYFKDTKDAFLVHISKNKTTCVFMQDSIIEKTHSIKIGSDKLFNAFLEDKKTKNASLDALEMHPKSKLKTILNELKKAIDKAFIFFNPDTEDKLSMILTGDLKSFKNVDEYLKSEKVLKVLKNDTLEKKLELKTFAISIGLCLNLLTKDNLSIQFRTEAFTAKRQLEITGKKMLSLSLVFIIFFLALFGGSSYFLKMHEKTLEQKFIQTRSFEKKFLKEDRDEISLNVYEDIDEFDKKLQRENRNFIYFLKVPNTTQTLNWLNTHEFLKGAEILSFNYTLEKYPSVFAKNERYIAKVGLEIKTSKPSIARGFYDSLSKDAKVDQGKKITWQVKDDLYKTSFYLKSSN